jgi:hypothetical protein
VWRILKYISPRLSLLNASSRDIRAVDKAPEARPRLIWCEKYQTLNYGKEYATLGGLSQTCFFRGETQCVGVAEAVFADVNHALVVDRLLD